MPEFRWDRLLETCVKKSTNAVLVAGFSGFMRSEFGLQRLLMPELTADTMQTILAEIMPPPHEVEEVPGCRSFSLRYGTEYKFRVDILGSPAPMSVILTLLPPDAPPSLREGGRWYQGWHVTGLGNMSWSELFTFCGSHKGSDAILVPGCPAMTRSRWGLHVFGVPPLSSNEVAAMVAEIMPSSDRRVQEEGYLSFDLRFTPTHHVFRAAIFGDPSPQLVLLMRMPTGGQLGHVASTL